MDVEFFGVPLSDANEVVFVLDHSGSMEGVSAGVSGQQLGMSRTASVVASIGAELGNAATGGNIASKMQVAKAELERVLAQLPAGTRFNVLFFDTSLRELSSSMLVMDESVRARSIAFVRSIEAGGGTAAVPALRAAYGYGARRVVLLSDGLANSGGSASELLQDARLQMRAGVRFDTIGLGIDQDAGLMQTLAAESGGLAFTR